MDLPVQLKDTVAHGNSRYPFAVHDTVAVAEGLLMLYLIADTVRSEKEERAKKAQQSGEGENHE